MTDLNLTEKEIAVLVAWPTCYDNAEDTASDLGSTWTDARDVAKAASMKLDTAKGVVGSLVKKGLVHADDDGEIPALCLSEKGAYACFGQRAPEAPVEPAKPFTVVWTDETAGEQTSAHDSERGAKNKARKLSKEFGFVAVRSANTEWLFIEGKQSGVRELAQPDVEPVAESAEAIEFNDHVEELAAKMALRKGTNRKAWFVALMNSPECELAEDELAEAIYGKRGRPDNVRGALDMIGRGGNEQLLRVGYQIKTRIENGKKHYAIRTAKS